MEPKACQPGNDLKRRFYIKIQREVNEVSDEYSKQNLSRFSLKVPDSHMKHNSNTNSVFSSSMDQNLIPFQITKFLSSNSCRAAQFHKDERYDNISLSNSNDSRSLTLSEKKLPAHKTKSQICSPVCMII